MHRPTTLHHLFMVHTSTGAAKEVGAVAGADGIKKAVKFWKEDRDQTLPTLAVLKYEIASRQASVGALRVHGGDLCM